MLNVNDGRTTDDGQKVIRIAHLEPLALGYLKNLNQSRQTPGIVQKSPYSSISRAIKEYVYHLS